MSEADIRRLIRFALPGGYALLIGWFFEIVFGWAFRKPVDELVSTTTAGMIATIGGAVIVGFIHYQMYYAAHRPVIDLSGGRLSIKGHGLRILTRRIDDLGGAVLQGLKGNELAERALERGYGLKHGLEPCLLPPRPTHQEREHYTSVLDERRDVMEALLDTLADHGSATPVESYEKKADYYHALGACQATLTSITLATTIDILTKHQHAFATHLPRCLEVSALSLALFIGTWQTIKRNRRNSWHSMASRLRNGIRAWAYEHHDILATLANQKTPEDIQDMLWPSTPIHARHTPRQTRR